MSFISDMRSYIDTQILTVDADLVFLDDAFGEKDLANSTADKFYKLWYGETRGSKDGNSYKNEFPLFIEIYDLRKRDETTTFDDLYCKAIDVKDAITNPVDNRNQTFWTEAEFITLTPNKQEEDDKSFQMLLEFNIIRDLKF